MKFVRAVASAVLVAFVAGCTVQSMDHKRVGEPVAGSAERVTSLRVVFDPRPPATGRIVSSGYGYATPASIYAPEARSAMTQFQSVFSSGFRDRFPELARAYGVEVSPTGLETLLLRVTAITTYCTGRCQTRVRLGGVLRDVGGKVIWTVNSNVGQKSVFASISDEMFDAVARELLEAMKSDRVIGGK